MTREELMEKVRALPDRPGVYLMHDAEGNVLYVGKAKSLKKRVASYFRVGSFASPRLRKLVDSIVDLSTIRTESEVEALILEARLIRKYQPFFNVELKMGDRYPYVKITNERFPRIVVTRHKEDDGATYLGPFTRVADVRLLLRLIERHFPLRSCARNLEGPIPGMRPCVKHALGKCMAPCAGMCTESLYRERVADVLLLLSGNSGGLVERLRRRMDAAARGMAFEEAARLRDTIRALWRYTRQRTGLAGQRDLDTGTWNTLVALQKALNLKTLPWRIDGFDISHFAGGEMVGVAVVFEQGAPNPSLYRRFGVRTVVGVDDFRALREVVGRRYRRVLEGSEPMPQLVLIDGGPQQLRFAREALEELGLSEIPMVALAKREEELFLPERDEPLLLALDDPALLLLRRVRDEAHRFAVGSHHASGRSRLRRSALEDIPGVGKKKAAALLAKFGSVQRIALLSEEEIAQVSGIGIALARRIAGALGKVAEGEEERNDETTATGD